MSMPDVALLDAVAEAAQAAGRFLFDAPVAMPTATTRAQFADAVDAPAAALMRAPFAAAAAHGLRRETRRTDPE